MITTQDLKQKNLAELYRMRREVRADLTRIQWKIQEAEKRQQKREAKTK